MAEGFSVACKALAGRQAYFLEVPGAATAAALSAVPLEAVERIGVPHEVTVQLTHPLELDRADYLASGGGMTSAHCRVEPTCSQQHHV